MDGRAKFYVLGDGTLTQWADVRVPDGAGFEQVAVIGKQLLDLLGDHGLEVTPPPPSPVLARPPEEDRLPSGLLPKPEPRPYSSRRNLSSQEIYNFINTHEAVATNELRELLGISTKILNNRLFYLSRSKRISQSLDGRWKTAVHRRLDEGKDEPEPPPPRPHAPRDPTILNTAQMEEWIQAHPGLNRAQIRERTGMTMDQVANRVNKLRMARRLHLSEDGTYWPVEEAGARRAEPSQISSSQ